MLTLTRTQGGWLVEHRVAGVLWWSVQYKTEAEAREALRRHMEGREVSRQRDREEFVSIMAAEGISLDIARYLMRQATTLHRLAEASCNGEGHEHPGGPRHWVKPDGSGTWCEVVLEPETRRTGRRGMVTCPDCRAAEREADVVRVLKVIGAKVEPLFQGDPRGAVLKLKVPSGRTNDWGQTGICVP